MHRGLEKQNKSFSVFSDIFYVEHCKRTLQADVRVVSSPPSTHLVSRQTIGTQLPHHVHPLWIRTRFLKQVAFHALRFAALAWELGNRLAGRMWIEGPYIALHMRLEKDTWIRTGCLTGLGSQYDAIIRRDRDLQPELLARSLNMSHIRRRLASKYLGNGKGPTHLYGQCLKNEAGVAIGIIGRTSKLVAEETYGIVQRGQWCFDQLYCDLLKAELFADYVSVWATKFQNKPMALLIVDGSDFAVLSSAISSPNG